MRQLEERLEQGDFTARDELRRMFVERPDDLSSQAPRLFASVCSHEEVGAFEEALEAVDDLAAARRLIVSLGLTLSPAAIPVLLRYREVFDPPNTDEYVIMALETIASIPGLDAGTVGSAATKRAYSGLRSSLDTGFYYYQGRPVFAGDMTKELVVGATVALREGGPLAAVYEIELLDAFSGLNCPVSRGERVTDAKMKEVLAYVHQIAGMSWERGLKYFHRHRVP